MLALLAAGAVTVALAAPAAGLELGQPDDRNLTTDTTQRQAYDRLAEGFGAGVNGPLVVAVSLPDGAADEALERLTERLAADREVVDVAAPTLNEARDTAVITVTPAHGPQDENTRALVDRLRADAIPAALRDTGATAYVGGRTARYGDEADKIASRIPLFAAAVVGLSLLLLLAAFRSWRISLLSAVFNLASIAAAYGVVALAFQTATGASLLGIEQQPVVPYVPLFMFAILFGLSTDYNVFLLSRVREEWGRHANHRAAIAAASAGTRKIITAAGAIMIAVFLGFATDPDPVIKMTGVGLATAVLVDVTLVRLFMAPAALTLLGDRLWPSRRDRRAARRRAGRRRRRVTSRGTLRSAPGAATITRALTRSLRPRRRWRSRASGSRSPSRREPSPSPTWPARSPTPPRSLGGWIYLAVAALIFLETSALVGFVIHGELVLLVGGVAAERGDASLAARHRAGGGRGGRRRRGELPARPAARAPVPRARAASASAPRGSPASTASSRATAARPSSSVASPGSCAPRCRSSPAARAWRCAG